VNGPIADDNRWGAFVPGPRAHAAPLGRGPLDGLRLAVKDLIDVAGVVTTGGNPDWARAQAPAACHADVVRRLLEAGATLVGKTVTDELAFSLEGENAHHGTPCNPRAPGRLPGGSSSGSAVAVASGAAEIALGTDTGGSVRIPAAFCGVFGFRPTHGRVSLAGVLPFAPSYDTVGWMAADAARLQAVGEALLGGEDATAALRLHWAADVAALADAPVRERVLAATGALALAGSIGAFGDAPAVVLDAYATLQGDEIRRALGVWIEATRPRFGPAIAERFAGLASITPAQVADARAWRAAERERLDRLLEGGIALVFPTAPCTALPLGAPALQRANFYATALAVNALAGHAGLPQVTLPAGTVDGAPVGLSIVGPRGSDRRLLAFAAAAATASRGASTS
jgi:amidase